MDTRQRFDQNRRSVLDGYVTPGEHKGPDLRGRQREPLQLSITDALVAREYNPTMYACMRQPSFIRCTFVEVVGVTFNDGPSSTQCFNYRQAVKRLVNEQDE